MGNIHIGTQGWNYDGWVGAFYPPGTNAKDYLTTYVEAFDTVEIDSTFYAIPPETTLEGWRKRAPAGFRYALKLPQEITHRARFVDVNAILEAFCERVRLLQTALGTILIQCPPDLSPRILRAFEKFLALLPPDLRFAVEFRDRTWLENDIGNITLGLLEKFGVALALTDSQWIPRELCFALAQHTAVKNAPFAYVRWMGARVLTDFSRVQIDRAQEFDEWAKCLLDLRQTVPLIDGYFNNHYQGHSPASANTMKRLLALPVVAPEDLIKQPALF